MTEIFGYPTIGTTEKKDLGGALYGCKFSAIAGKALSISAYVEIGTTRRVKCALYSTDGNLIATTIEKYGEGAAQWMTFNFPSPVQLTDAAYILAIQAEGADVNVPGWTLSWIYDDRGGAAGQTLGTGHNYGTWPNPITWGGSEPAILSIYCTVDTGGGAQPSGNLVYIVGGLVVLVAAAAYLLLRKK